jgi:hypothetical protein
MPRRPLPIRTLRTIADKRRDDPDVLALLWEIKRLHGVLVQSRDMLAELGRNNTDPDRGKRAYALLKALALEPGVIAATEPARIRHNPSLPDTRPPRRWKPERGPVTGHAEQRAKQVQEEDEREAKRRARQERS